ncbi:MAG: AAA family ATPase [Candidatus Cloacimonetes bacterium]|nr:AAA family ATPase [Candidatus Cloacimonadota bacterium]
MSEALDLEAVKQKIDEKHHLIERVYQEMSKEVIGQKYMIERLLMGLLAGGHILLEGVPGLAKTTTVNALSKTLKTSFKRIQFTPDLLPADLIGTQIYNPKSADFYIKKGPLFANIVLADEINRAPAKVQSALLEAMQEKQVTIGDESFNLDEPFLVLATQNPVEQEGTYPLPEAQVDRFMLKISVGYPSKDEELEIMKMISYSKSEKIESVMSVEDLIEIRKVIDLVHVDEKINQYIIDLIFATRDPLAYGITGLEGLIQYGASPRASIYLNKLARVYAFLQGRAYVVPNDIKAIGMDVLRHRVLVTFEAEAEEKTSEDIIEQVFDSVKVP